MGPSVLGAFGRQKPRRAIRIVQVLKLAALGFGDFTDPGRCEQGDSQGKAHRAGNWPLNDSMPEQAKLAVAQDPAPDVLDSALPKAGTWIGVNQIRIDGKAENRTDKGLHPVCVRRCSGRNHAFAQGDYIAALDFVKAPIGPLRENMKPQVALVCGRRSLKPAGVFL
jgi:hypothetical protein